MSLSKRYIQSTSWNLVTNIIRVLVLFSRFTFLSRWLPKEVFGTYSTAILIVTATISLASFGVGGAFLNRTPETENEDRAAQIHFSLRLIFSTIWATAVLLFAQIFLQGSTRTTLVILTLVHAGLEILQVPRLILVRRVEHKRLAIIELLNTFISSAVALWLAWNWRSIWALLVVDITYLLVTFFFLVVWKPIWRIRPGWDKQIIHYYLSFGRYNFGGGVLLRALDKFDDLWVRIYLGNIALADYSRAYTLATYPRQLLARAVDEVAVGTYAELKSDRKRLSQAFFRTNALLIRSGFFLAGGLAIIAPEFVLIILTEKWMPMLPAFQLMLVFTLLDPIKLTVGLLFNAIGKPRIVLQARVVQLVVLIILMYFLGFRWGIAGIALAVDGMLLAGIGYLFWSAKAEVDFSLARMFGAPTIGIFLGLFLAWIFISRFGGLPPWIAALSKGAVFVLTYGSTLILLERGEMIRILSTAKQLFDHNIKQKY